MENSYFYFFKSPDVPLSPNHNDSPSLQKYFPLDVEADGVQKKQD